MNERRRALGLAVVAFVAAGLVVSSMRRREEPSEAAGVADPRPPKPALESSGAVAIDEPRSVDAGPLLVPLRVPLAIAPQAFDAGASDTAVRVRTAPIDTETGRPLEPPRVREGAGSGQPIPRRILDRGNR